MRDELAVPRFRAVAWVLIYSLMEERVLQKLGFVTSWNVLNPEQGAFFPKGWAERNSNDDEGVGRGVSRKLDSW